MRPAYVLTVIPELSRPILITRVGPESDNEFAIVERDIPVRGTSLADAADAILRDYRGRGSSIAEVAAFARFAFGGMEGTTLAITLKAEKIDRFLEAAERDAVRRVA